MAVLTKDSYEFKVRARDMFTDKEQSAEGLGATDRICVVINTQTDRNHQT